MDNIEKNNDETWGREMEKANRRGKVAGGLLIITAGVLFLLRETGTELPYWVFSWKTILIAIGLVIRQLEANGSGYIEPSNKKGEI